MQGLLSKEMLADLVINIANIVILFLVTKALVYKPVKKYLNARREKLAAEAEEAAALAKQAEETQAEYEALLQNADGVRAELLSKAQAEARESAEKITNDAKNAAAETVRQAQAEAAAEKQRTVAEAQAEITDLAFTLSEKIMGRAASDADTRRMAEAFFEGSAQ